MIEFFDKIETTTIDRILTAHDKRDATIALNDLAMSHHGKERFGDAKMLYKLAISIFNNIASKDDLDYLNMTRSISNLATIYEHRRKYNHAEILYRWVLEIYKEPLEPIHIAQSCHNLAKIYEMQHKTHDAIKMYKREVCIRKRILGLNHISTVQTIENLGNICVRRNLYSDAIPLYVDMAMICDAMLEQEDLLTATAWDNLAALYNRQGNHRVAASFHRKALTI
ncbi:hypothetical protein BC938DRAFT_473710 [Jimgerdemannia flammicorona]|uniref:Kinesin light chain n=1 Tax=Jimgerdemannia flammicorona TaxID=994334 RepID=A0A433QT50_9FUNG|nr:hypothetical protein BC938DRAFT_473710 [Jimgerdemannia flammicorona]